LKSNGVLESFVASQRKDSRETRIGKVISKLIAAEKIDTAKFNSAKTLIGKVNIKLIAEKIDAAKFNSAKQNQFT